MRRNGKIAALSQMLREELNERLEAGEQGKDLVKWLNSLPEVKDRMRFCFRGKPITEQNLSQWKKGGYRDWQEKEERRHMLHRLREEFEEIEHIVDPEETQRHLSVMLTLELARAVQEIKENTPDLKERLERLEPVIGKFAQLRREESNARRVEMQWKLHRSELGVGGGGFGVEGALERLEREVGEESDAFASAATVKVEKKPSVAAGPKKSNGKKRARPEGKSRPAGETGPDQVKGKESQDPEAERVAQKASSQAVAGEAAELTQSNPGGSHPIKVDQSSGASFPHEPRENIEHRTPNIEHRTSSE
ncbi:MAG TPA: hypothetical protein VKV04_25635 [Verrucomicrobiae bacterium]|nr:hypothetical protein [Verrucomicrobiae bacterium]